MEGVLSFKTLKYFLNTFILILKEMLGDFQDFFCDFMKYTENFIVSIWLLSWNASVQTPSELSGFPLFPGTAFQQKFNY